ncbi:uncharacterized protein VTP21DRAFT_8952 [Calcarisporiella thermophila]|uniref:uncharacterized protein n=1 Tax=Calcarisporiella thermophila TaxID=911321 RepID=UPI00374431BC
MEKLETTVESSELRHRAKDSLKSLDNEQENANLGVNEPSSLNEKTPGTNQNGESAEEIRGGENTRSGRDDRICRICLAGVEEEEELGRLFSPCLCNGTMKYVHVNCLNRWRVSSRKSSSYFQCDSCKFKYRYNRTTYAKIFSSEISLTFITLLVFLIYAFLAGFLMKIILHFIDTPEAPPSSPANQILPYYEPLTWREVFTVDGAHMLLGLLFVGFIGFLQILLSLVWLGPFQGWGGLRVIRVGGGGNRDEGRLNGAVLTILVVIGGLRAIYGIWMGVRRLNRRLLNSVEMAILDVNQ